MRGACPETTPALLAILANHRLDDEKEHDRGDHGERDQRVEERAIEELTAVDLECQRREVRLTPDRGDERRDQVRDEGSHDGTEGNADHDADGHVHEVPAEQKLSEVLQREPPSTTTVHARWK